MIPRATAEQLARHVEAEPVNWRQVARTAFWPCRSADEVRAAFGRVWREAELPRPGEWAAIEAEFIAALARFREAERPRGRPASERTVKA